MPVYLQKVKKDPTRPFADLITAFINTYDAERKRESEQSREKAKYAQDIAEATGKYTPELEKQFLEPMTERPSILQKGVGDIGRALGMKTEYGQPKEFQLPGVPGLKTKYERQIEEEGENR